MKQLLIVANPRLESFSFAIVQKYKTLSESQGNVVTVLDLYRIGSDKEKYFKLLEKRV